MTQERYIVDHKVIREWAEERGGKPAAVASTTTEDDAGILRIDFPGHGEDDNLEHIAWEDWFDKFDRNDLVMVLQHETADGSTSRFNKIVSRNSIDDR
jgi:hypothetical protein